MPFTDNQLKGNWGEQHVAERLAACGCLMSHVPQGHDSGIDLYCETTHQGSPFLHFWCQAKVRQDYATEAKSCSYTASPDELTYWLSQPIPIFLFLLPDNRGGQPPIFVCSPLRREGLKMLSFQKLESSRSLGEFLEKGLPIETFLWELHHGKVSWLKSPQANYTIQLPVKITDKFEPQLRESLHRTLWRLSEDILCQSFDLASLSPRTNDPTVRTQTIESARPYIEALEKIIEGKRIGNYQNFMTVGILAELQGDRPKAIACYQRALKSIDDDPQIDASIDPWKTTRGKVEAHLSRVSSEGDIATRGKNRG